MPGGDRGGLFFVFPATAAGIDAQVASGLFPGFRDMQLKVGQELQDGEVFGSSDDTILD